MKKRHPFFEKFLFLRFYLILTYQFETLAKSYEQSNQHYLDLFQANRKLAIDEIYLDHKPYFIHYLKQYYPINSDLDMIYTDAVLVLIEKLPNPLFQLTCTIQTYLNAIGKNKLFKLINREPELSTLPDGFDCSDWLDEIELDGISPLEYAIFKKVFNQMAEARSKCYEIFQRFYFHCQSMKEIANELGYGTEANARQQKYKCLLSLKKNIAKQLKK